MDDTPSLLGPITDQDVTRWQLNGAKALAELLIEAFSHQLPALGWRIGSGSNLYGAADGPSIDPAARRAAFDRWVAHLGAIVWRDTTDPTGVTRLRAKVEDYLGVHITIAADLHDQD